MQGAEWVESETSTRNQVSLLGVAFRVLKEGAGSGDREVHVLLLHSGRP